jgi:hypothetical protein
MEVRFLAEVKRFFRLASVSRPALGPTQPLYNGYRGPIPGGKAWQRRDADHSPSSSVEVVNEQELYILSPPAPP